MYLFSYTKISAALKPISIYLKFSAFKHLEWAKDICGHFAKKIHL